MISFAYVSPVIINDTIYGIDLVKDLPHIVNNFPVLVMYLT